jgi:hypothetical protein
MNSREAFMGAWMTLLLVLVLLVLLPLVLLVLLPVLKQYLKKCHRKSATDTAAGPAGCDLFLLLLPVLVLLQAYGWFKEFAAAAIVAAAADTAGDAAAAAAAANAVAFGTAARARIVEGSQW